MSTLNYPKIGTTDDQKVFVSFYLNKKRYRLFNGKRIGQNIDPNSFPSHLRIPQAQLLAAEVYKHISSGGVFTEYRADSLVSGEYSEVELLEQALKMKLSADYTNKYKEELKFSFELLMKNVVGPDIKKDEVVKTMGYYKNRSSYNSLRKNLNALFNQAVSIGLKHNPIQDIKRLRGKANLNKPFDNIAEVLDEIKAYNDSLYLCCLLTYACLLRPHREIRELKWGDFSNDLTFINLSGNRNKSGRNRIVPVPYYVKEVLKKKERHLNIFTGNEIAPNQDYFKTIWGRYKKVSKLLGQDQTLYSFRHSGAIDIFKRTGSLTKLQKAMGHSSLAVSLTYLRGLEVCELDESDMPII
jgi:integrase